MYWQAFPPGGESDLSARHQQVVLKKKCPAIDTVIQYKAGAGGALLWSQTNTLPGDGANVVGVNLPHMVLQTMEGVVQYKTDDVTPVYWFHYTPDALVVPDQSPITSWTDFIKAAKDAPGKLNLGGSGLNSANHAAHQRMRSPARPAQHARTSTSGCTPVVDASGEPSRDRAAAASSVTLSR